MDGKVCQMYQMHIGWYTETRFTHVVFPWLPSDASRAPVQGKIPDHYVCVRN